jgi:hypothetical protein
MEWTQSETLGLATVDCTRCHGSGRQYQRDGGTRPCECVLRAIFRACYARFKICIFKEKNLSRVTLEYTHHGGRRITWGRKDEEFLADFFLVSRRVLTPAEWQLFSYYFLLGADWKLCARRLGFDRGLFFHAVYRIQAKLGRSYRELKPYALFPLDEYFQGRTENDWEGMGGPNVVRMRRASLHWRLQVPVKKVA